MNGATPFDKIHTAARFHANAAKRTAARFVTFAQNAQGKKSKGNTAQRLCVYCEARFFARLYNEDDARLCALLGRIVQDDGKYASKTRAKSNKWSLCGVA